MSRFATIAAEIVAVIVLCFGLYFPRYKRKDMVLAYLGLNVCVLTASIALTSNSVANTGLGFGLFGILSIIRLRSFELGHQEIAYYFAAIALGLIGGLQLDPTWLSYALLASIVVVLAVADFPGLLGNYRHQLVTLDRAITNEAELRAELEQILNADVARFQTQRLDLVNDSMIVDVRYRVRS